MIIRREDQLNDLRNETLFKFGGERVLVELQVQGSSALIKVGVGAQTKDVIIRFVVAAVGYHGWNNKIILDTNRARGSELYLQHRFFCGVSEPHHVLRCRNRRPFSRHFRGDSGLVDLSAAILMMMLISRILSSKESLEVKLITHGHQLKHAITLYHAFAVTRHQLFLGDIL